MNAPNITTKNYGMTKKPRRILRKGIDDAAPMLY